jgi:hypothetical protein
VIQDVLEEISQRVVEVGEMHLQTVAAQGAATHCGGASTAVTTTATATTTVARGVKPGFAISRGKRRVKPLQLPVTRPPPPPPPTPTP